MCTCDTLITRCKIEGGFDVWFILMDTRGCLQATLENVTCSTIVQLNTETTGNGADKAVVSGHAGLLGLVYSTVCICFILIFRIFFNPQHRESCCISSKAYLDRFSCCGVWDHTFSD